MIPLARSGDITAALGGSNASHTGEPGKRSVQKWRQQVKIMTTRITVIRRFARRYSAKSFQCSIAPGLTAASPQLISKVKDLIGKIKTSEGSNTRNLSTGAHFSPNTRVQDATKEKVKLRTSEKKNGEGFSFKVGDVFKDHLTLSTLQIALTFLVTFKILEEADLLDEAFGLIIVTVITLDSRQEGTTATYNPIARTVLKGLLVLLYLSTFEKSGVNAQDDTEGDLEGPDQPVGLPYNVQLAAWTFVAGIFMIAVIFNVAGRINRRPLVPAPAAAPVAVRPPAAGPLALPGPGAPPPAVIVPANAIGFINVMEVLEDNPDAARIHDPDFDIPPYLPSD